jgi:triosephosphate isomerase
MRRPVIAGNWKMNPATLDDARALAAAVAAEAADVPDVTTVVCPPTIWLAEVARSVTGGTVHVGAQTMHFEEKGAFTGETSPLMLAGIAEFVILGHSERRQYDGETDEKVGRKVASAVAHGLRPIAAVGELADERRRGQTSEVIDRHVRAAHAQAVAAQIRAILRELDPHAADEVPIQYGGSVTDENAAEFFGQSDIDGALVGGASLKPEAFAAILRAAAAAHRTA